MYFVSNGVDGTWVISGLDRRLILRKQTTEEYRELSAMYRVY